MLTSAAARWESVESEGGRELVVEGASVDELVVSTELEIEEEEEEEDGDDELEESEVIVDGLELGFESALEVAEGDEVSDVVGGSGCAVVTIVTKSVSRTVISERIEEIMSPRSALD